MRRHFTIANRENFAILFRFRLFFVFLSKNFIIFLLKFFETLRCHNSRVYGIIYLAKICPASGGRNFSNGGIQYAYANGFPLVWRG